MDRLGFPFLIVLAAAGLSCRTTTGRGQGAAARWHEPASELRPALERFAPILVQERTAETPGARWDMPTALDPDGSGTLADDQWRRGVEAPARPVLFSESGGHGLYDNGESRPWRPHGGRFYPSGPAGVGPEATLLIGDRFGPVFEDVSAAKGPSILREISAQLVPIYLRPLSDLEPFVDPDRRAFRDLPRGATPPWFWGGGGAPRGAIVRDPAALYAALRKAGSRGAASPAGRPVSESRVVDAK